MSETATLTTPATEEAAGGKLFRILVGICASDGPPGCRCPNCWASGDLEGKHESEVRQIAHQRGIAGWAERPLADLIAAIRKVDRKNHLYEAYEAHVNRCRSSKLPVTPSDVYVNDVILSASDLTKHNMGPHSRKFERLPDAAPTARETPKRSR